MSTHLNLDRFIEYVDITPDLRPLWHFRAKAFGADDSLQQGKIEPWGQVILYPAFVVFLSEENHAQTFSSQSL